MQNNSLKKKSNWVSGISYINVNSSVLMAGMSCTFK